MNGSVPLPLPAREIIVVAYLVTIGLDRTFGAAGDESPAAAAPASAGQ